MKYTQLFIQTFKENPNDAQLVSHQLLHRAGFTVKSGAGLYHYSALMTKVVEKTKRIIKEELESIGSVEVALTFTTPAELWQESKRWDELGHLMVKFKDRMDRYLCLSPTNEEAVVDYFRKSAKSYKQLPICLFQINTKFRDEIRPRFGLMRAREFLMKDAYSFHASEECLEDTYQQMYTAYSAIFNRMGLDYITVQADAGAMAEVGSKTHEFQAIATSGEDQLVVCRKENMAMNVEMAKTVRANVENVYSKDAYTPFDTPNIKTIKQITDYLNVPAAQTIKSVLLKGEQQNKQVFVLACCLGDDDINITKCSSFTQILDLEPASQLEFSNLNLVQGFVGPINLLDKSIEIIVDQHIDLNASYVVGGNKVNTHIKNLVFNRDVPTFKSADIRQSQLTDTTQEGNQIEFLKGIEVGHIFQLGSKYTAAMKATVLDKDGKAMNPTMGCYGIGVGRAIAAVVEQRADEKGIVWPKSIAPYTFVFIPLVSKDPAYHEKVLACYEQCKKERLDVILDDRNVSPGVKFKDADLIGFPQQLIFGKAFKTKNMVEHCERSTGEKSLIEFDNIISFIKKESKRS